jgi:CO/xanthine dehydrogenase Mo-binding subunit
VLRSPHPHARIVALDVQRTRAMPGVRAVVTEGDLPVGFLCGIRVKDQPVLARDVVRYVGEPVAALAADTLEQARAALAAIAVTYEPLPIVDDPQQALCTGVPALHPRGNLCHSTSFVRGDVAAILAQAAHVVEDVYETPCQMHAALELDGGVAVPRPGGGLTVFAPCQHPHGVRSVVCEMLGLPVEAVEVVGSPLGGAYGGKEDLHIQPLLALLAARSGRAVRLSMTRPEVMDCSIKRHRFRIRMRTSCDAGGRLLSHEVDALADTGAYASHGPEVLDTAHENAQGPYRFDAVRLEGRLVYTNNGIAGAFRGFGALQMQVALELNIDRLANVCGIDPVAFRRNNLRPFDPVGPLGQTIAPQPEISAVLDRMAVHPLRRARPQPVPRRTIYGVGSALVTKGEGFAGVNAAAYRPNAASAIVALTAAGIEYRCALAEMGQGVSAAMSAALARQLGVARVDIRAIAGSTVRTPDAGPTSASRGTQVAFRLARIAAPAFRPIVVAAAGKVLGVAPSRLSLGPGGVYIDGEPRNAPAIGFAELGALESFEHVAHMAAIECADGAGAAHKLNTACGAIALVSVDTRTGRIVCERMALMPACGPVLAPDAFLGQLEGAAAMAAGFVLTENLPSRGGRHLVRNLDGYLVPTIRDAPAVTVDAIEELAPGDPVGIRGVGEIPMNAAVPAIASAIYNALGTAPTRLPVDPAWVLGTLAARRTP